MAINQAPRSALGLHAAFADISIQCVNLQGMKRSLTIAPVLFLFVSHVFAEEQLLEKVPQLQDTARRANRGQLGSGIGTVTLITSRGQVKAESGLDAIRVFGSTIKVSDLLPLLEARAQFNRTGISNPMSGEVSALTYVVLYTLSLAKSGYHTCDCRITRRSRGRYLRLGSNSSL